MVNRLLLVTSSYPGTGEGEAAAGSFVADFAAALSSHCRVGVVCPGRSSSSTQQGPALTIHRFAVPRLPLSLLSAGRLADWPAIASTLRAGQAAVTHACEQECPDHILALWALPCGEWARRSGVPYTIWALGSDIWTLGRLPLVRQALRHVLRRATHRFADGLQLADDVEQLSGRPCAFLASSRRLPRREKTARAVDGPLKLAFLGRWHVNKGVDLLLDALGQLDEATWTRIESVRIAGGGPLETTVRQGCATLRAAGRPVHDEGYLDRDAAADLLAWADRLLLPSRIESIPVVYSDALQAGCPLVGMPVGDLPRLLQEDRSGWLAEAVTASAFAAAIRHSVAPQQPLPAFAPGAVERFSVEANAMLLLERLANEP